MPSETGPAAGNQYNPDTRPGQEDRIAQFSAPMPPMPDFGGDKYKEEVWRLRTKARGMTPRLNPYNINFQNQSPTAQSSYFAGTQSGWGIPQADQQNEYQRYRLRGLRR